MCKILRTIFDLKEVVYPAVDRSVINRRNIRTYRVHIYICTLQLILAH